MHLLWRRFCVFCSWRILCINYWVTCFVLEGPQRAISKQHAERLELCLCWLAWILVPYVSLYIYNYYNQELSDALWSLSHECRRTRVFLILCVVLIYLLSLLATFWLLFECIESRVALGVIAFWCDFGDECIISVRMRVDDNDTVFLNMLGFAEAKLDINRN